jgi:hypothetical protein
MVASEAQRRVRQDLQRHHRVGRRLGAAEDVGASELRVVAGATTTELVRAGREPGELLDEIVGMPGQRVGEHQR